MATNKGKSFFARFIDKPTPGIDERSQKIQHAQRVLDWLQRWDGPVVGLRDFRAYGPRPRDPESASSAAKILVAHGWLRPLQAHRCDRQVWQIVRRPIINPTISDDAVLQTQI
jgi:hypothetical protein